MAEGLHARRTSSEGSPLAAFQLLKEAGFEGVELISPNRLDRRAVLEARDQTGLVIHGVSGARHWQDTLSDPDPGVVERGMAAIRQEFDDCRAYGGTTVLVVPAVVNKKVGYRDAYQRSQANIRKLIPDAEKHGVKIAIEEVWNRFLLSPIEFARYIDEFDIPMGRRLFRRRQRRRVRLSRGVDPRAGQANPQGPHQGVCQAEAIRLPAGRRQGDRLAGGRRRAPRVGYDGWITAEVPFGNLERDEGRRSPGWIGCCNGNDPILHGATSTHLRDVTVTTHSGDPSGTAMVGTPGGPAKSNSEWIS